MVCAAFSMLYSLLGMEHCFHMDKAIQSNYIHLKSILEVKCHMGTCAFVKITHCVLHCHLFKFSCHFLCVHFNSMHT